MTKQGLYYTKEHEWAHVQDNTATIGITEHAQESLGEITYVELPSDDTEVSAGSEMATAESSKAASDIYAPLSGKIIETNSELQTSPEMINEDCYGKGWLCKIKIKDKSELEKLMDAAGYDEYLKTVD
jgi:glycine cleavage system H protein